MPTFEDRFGLPLTTASALAAQSYVEGVDCLLSFDAGADECFDRAIADDPAFALPHAALAVLLWQLGEREDAQVHAHLALALTAGTSEREQGHIAAIVAVVDGGGYIDGSGRQTANPEAMARGREHLREYPRDAIILFLQIILTIFSGRRDEQQELLRLFQGLQGRYGDDWWFLSWCAFCHQELGNTDQGRLFTQRALELHPQNAIAAHSMAHVLYESRQYAEGADFLREWLADYRPDALYHSHVTWHYAMCELMQGQGERAIAAYRRAIDPAAVRPARTTLADAVGLLWCCHLYRASAAPLPWEGIRDYAARLVQPGLPFRDVLTATAFAGAGDADALDRLTEALAELADEDYPLVGPLVLPLVHGIRAFAREAYDETIRWLEPVVDQTWRIGGSNEQRELFDETLMEACLRTGQQERAETVLRQRMERLRSARVSFWQARMQARRAGSV